MSEEIIELDISKYLVFKWDDIGKYLTLSQKEELHKIIKTITIERELFKLMPQNQYLVLNLEDEINVLDMFDKLLKITNWDPEEYIDIENIKVKDIAVALVNAILKAK